MTPQSKPDFIEFCGILNNHRVDYLVIGGWAGIIYGLPRTTQDVDIFVPRDPANCRRLIEALASIGFGTARELVPDDILRRAVFLFADQIRVDIFMTPWGLSDYGKAAVRKRVVEIRGVPIPVVGLEDLIASKATDRPQDQDDVKALRSILGRRSDTQK